MKKLDNLMDNVDERVDKVINPYTRFFKKYFVVFSSVFLLSLLAIFFIYVYKSKSQVLSSVIRNDFQEITRVLQHVDEQCNILAIKGGHVVLDFFTIKAFVGSEIGGMNLAHPKNWHGPYFRRNPTIKGIFYELIQAADGFFIIPGKGVKLPNGLMFGKDIIINRQINVLPMLQPGGKLHHKETSFAAKIPFEIGDWDATAPVKEETIEEVNKVLKEFNEAMSFAQRSSENIQSV